jgi:molybdopterin converting factor small subunit
MPTVAFTPALQRFVRTAELRVEGATVGAALDAVFAECPTLRGYVLDDQGAVRRHVNVFINGEMIGDRGGLGDPVGPHDQIYVIQALTGG